MALNEKMKDSLDSKDMIKIKDYDSPCGKLRLGSLGGSLCLCHWMQGKNAERDEKRLARKLKTVFETGTSSVIDAAQLQLDEYFERKRTDFDIPLLFIGTEFQKSVWNELLKISFGETTTYAEIARRILNPTSVRAVANACGANPIAIFTPCHRIIGSNGSLTGYAGGIEIKRILLDFESGNRLFH